MVTFLPLPLPSSASKIFMINPGDHFLLEHPVYATPLMGLDRDDGECHAL